MMQAAAAFHVSFTEWTDRATDTPLVYSLAYRAADHDAVVSDRAERTLVPAQASSRVTAVLPRGTWTLVGRVHDAHGTFVTVEAAATVTVAAAGAADGRRRRRRLTQADQQGSGSVTGRWKGGLEVEANTGEVSRELGVGRMEGRRLTQWDGVDDGWTPAEVAAAQAAAQRVEEALQTGAAVTAAQLAAAYAERFGGGGGGEVVEGECGGVRVSAAAVHTRVLRAVHAVRVSLAPTSDGVVRSLLPIHRLSPLFGLRLRFAGRPASWRPGAVVARRQQQSLSRLRSAAARLLHTHAQH